MSLQTELTRIEQGFWTGGEDYYLQHVDSDCLLAFGQMAGVRGREELAKMTGQNRWRAVHMDSKGFVTPTPDTAILTYEACGIRASGERYNALVSTSYVRRSGEWKMAFHQQTPLAGANSAN
jgi:hypothetical protein